MNQQTKLQSERTKHKIGLALEFIVMLIVSGSFVMLAASAICGQRDASFSKSITFAVEPSNDAAAKIEKTGAPSPASQKNVAEAPIVESLPSADASEKTVTGTVAFGIPFKGAAGGATTASGKRLFSYERAKPYPIASITKLMTAIIARKTLPQDEQIKITPEMLAVEGNRANFQEGEVFTVHDLIVSMMTVSSNNAAEAVALYVGKDAFVARMNEMAARLRMNDTHFEDATGLSPQNVSTINDIELLTRYVSEKYPDVFEISTQKTNTIKPVFSNVPRMLYNINAFAGRADFLGGKTGFLPESGGNLISIFKKNKETVIIIVFGTVDRFAETEKILNQL